MNRTEAAQVLAKAAAAHPRSRGENTIVVVVTKVERGSSPLTRGKHGPTSPPPQTPRLIPAHAGKTCACQSVSVRS